MFEQIKQKDSSYSSLFTINFLIDLSFVQHNLFQAKDINRYAKWIFEALSANPQHFDLEFSLNKRHTGKKQQKGQPTAPQRIVPNLLVRKA